MLDSVSKRWGRILQHVLSFENIIMVEKQESMAAVRVACEMLASARISRENRKNGSNNIVRKGLKGGPQLQL